MGEGDCLFCKIASGEVESDIVYKDERVVAFNDIDPKAPVHIVIIPRKHINTLVDLEGADYSLVGHIYKVANKLAKEKGIAEDGFRVVTNCNEEGGQVVFHLHFHLLGGRQLKSLG